MKELDSDYFNSVTQSENSVTNEQKEEKPSMLDNLFQIDFEKALGITNGKIDEFEN